MSICIRLWKRGLDLRIRKEKIPIVTDSITFDCPKKIVGGFENKFKVVEYKER